MTGQVLALDDTLQDTIPALLALKPDYCSVTWSAPAPTRIVSTYDTDGGVRPWKRIIQLRGAYLELLALTRPQDVPKDRPGHFSFAGFNRDYLARRTLGFERLEREVLPRFHPGRVAEVTGLSSSRLSDGSLNRALAISLTTSTSKPSSVFARGLR